MRNLKKVLSLTLALVMLIGMMVVGAGAAEIKDVDSVKADNKEAVEVMNALNILVGDENGNFNPNGNLNRAAAAKIILAVARGMNVVEAALKIDNSVMFDDITGDEKWAGGIADYCANLEIVKGTDPGKFSPADDVTILQFATMLARVMDPANVEKYTGADWEVNTKVFATQCGLTEALSIADWDAKMTREQAAQMAFNGLTTDPSGATKYVVKNAAGTSTLYDGDDYDIVKLVVAMNPGAKITVTKSTENTLGKQNYGLTTDESGDDGLGHAVKVWKQNGDPIWTGTESVDPATKTVAGEDFKITDGKYDGYSFAADGTITCIYNGTEITDTAAGEWYTKHQGHTGITIELYANSEKTITKIVATEPYFAIVKDVKESGIEVDVKEWTTKKTITIKPTDSDYALVKNMVKGDVFMGVFKGNWETREGKLLKVVGVPEAIEGKITAKKVVTARKDSYVTIGSDKYTIAWEWGGNGSNATNIPGPGSEGTLYVYNDFAYYFDPTSDPIPTGPDGYALVVSAGVIVSESGSWQNAGQNKKVEAVVVLSDGTSKTVELATKSGKNTSESQDGLYVMGTGTIDDSASNALYIGGVSSTGTITDSNNKLIGKVFSYKEKDGKLTLGALEITLSGANNKDKVACGTASGYATGATGGATSATVAGVDTLFNNKTVFVLYTVKDGKVTMGGTFTGPAALGKVNYTGVNMTGETPSNGTNYVVATAANGNDAGPNGTPAAANTSLATATVVFVNGTNAAITPDNYVYVLKDSVAQVLHNDKAVFSYEAYTMDGEKVTVYGDEVEGHTAIAANGLYKLGADSELGAVVSPAPDTVKSGTVTLLGDQIKVTGSATWYNMTEDTVKVIAVNGAKLEDGCTATLILDADETTVVTVIVTAGK